MRRRHTIFVGLVVLAFAALRLGAQQPRVELPLGFITDTIEAAGAIVQREYFDPQVGQDVARSLREGLSEGRFQSLSSPEDVAAALNQELDFLTHDKHLRVAVTRNLTASAVAGGSRADDVRRNNAGVQKVEILAGNVGYLNLTFFWRPEEAAEALDTAMHLLRNAAALIVDMRTNGGGAPQTVANLIGYIIDQPNRPLFDVIPRTGAREQYRTPGVLSTDANGRRPVFVLTSARTFSGGEGFAFLLQELKRAVVVGEVTSGAANAGQPRRVNDTFQITVPNAQVMSVVSGGNWEGKGVTPDVQVPAADALSVAHSRALAALGPAR